MKNIKDSLLLFLKGLAMGAADVIPGVSGGTVAFITGIYEELLESIKSINVEAFRLLFSGKWKALWEHINGSFLLTLFAGISISFLSLARFMTYLIEEHPIQLWSFFFGLIIISALMILREIKKWDYITAINLIAGTVIAYYITILTPASTPENMFFLFLSGMIAICAMVLPGISGSFLLLMLGKYEYIFNAIKEYNFGVLTPFALGCIVGILSFSRVISWFLKRFHDYAVAFLAGIMLGALNKIWPWKQVISYRLNSSGEQVPLIEENLLPAAYSKILSKNPHLLEAILFFALGIMVVVAIDRLAHYYKEPREKYRQD